MSQTTFWRYSSPGDVTFELRITDKNRMFLVRLGKDTDLEANPELLEGSDEERITKGIHRIDEITANLSSLDEEVGRARKELSKAREQLWE